MIHCEEIVAHRSHVEHLFSDLKGTLFKFPSLMPDIFQKHSVPMV